MLSSLPYPTLSIIPPPSPPPLTAPFTFNLIDDFSQLSSQCSVIHITEQLVQVEHVTVEQLKALLLLHRVVDCRRHLRWRVVVRVICCVRWHGINDSQLAHVIVLMTWKQKNNNGGFKLCCLSKEISNNSPVPIGKSLTFSFAHLHVWTLMNKDVLFFLQKATYLTRFFIVIMLCIFNTLYLLATNYIATSNPDNDVNIFIDRF